MGAVCRTGDSRFVVLDAAVMLEAGWNNETDWIVYIDASRPVRLARLAHRSGWTDSDLAARESAQWPEDVKKSLADAMILNNSDQDSLQREVDRLLRQWELLAWAPSRGVCDDGQSAEFSPECHGRSRNATAFPPAAGRLPPKDRVPAGEVHQCLKPSPTPRSPPVQLPLPRDRRPRPRRRARRPTTTLRGRDSR